MTGYRKWPGVCLIIAFRHLYAMFNTFRSLNMLIMMTDRLDIVSEDIFFCGNALVTPYFV